MTSKCILAKNLEGWEVMTVFAGEVGQSDKFFMVGGALWFRQAVGLIYHPTGVDIYDCRLRMRWSREPGAQAYRITTRTGSGGWVGSTQPRSVFPSHGLVSGHCRRPSRSSP